MKRESRASWAWSSLLGGREVIAAGSHWQIMGGGQTMLWRDRWIPSLIRGYPTPFHGATFDYNQLVSSIICKVSRCWQINEISDDISVGDQAIILDTVIDDKERQDRLI